MAPASFLKTLRFAAVLTVAGLLHGCSKPAEPDPPLRISINAWAGYALAYLAEERGYFRDRRAAVELIFRKDIHTSNQLFKDGEVDGTFCVLADAITFAWEGIGNRIVYVVDHSLAGDVIIGRPAFQSLADLRGAVIGFEGVNTFSHLFVIKSLQAVGLDEATVRLAHVPATEVLEALEAGRIDAAHTWQPETTEALQRGYRILGRAGDLPGLVTDVLVFHAPVIRHRERAVAGVVDGLLQARAYLQSHTEEAIRIMARRAGMSPELMRHALSEIHLLDRTENLAAMERRDEYSSLHYSGEAIAEFFMKRGQIVKKPNLDRLIDARFVAAAPAGAP